MTRYEPECPFWVVAALVLAISANSLMLGGFFQ